MEVDITLVAEHKLDTNQPRVMKKLNDQARETFGMGSFSINAVLMAIESSTMYKPGGILALVQGRIKGRILQAGRDPLGR